jgi:hypothetical protein
LLEPHGVRSERTQILLGLDDEAVLVLLGKLSRGADDLINEACQIDRLRIEVELAGFDLREIQYLVDEAKEVGAGGIDAAQRFQRLFRAEARGCQPSDFFGVVGAAGTIPKPEGAASNIV